MASYCAGDIVAAVFVGLPEVALIVLITAAIVVGMTLRVGRGKRKDKT